jgi:predicted small lipoprotein YifL
MTLLPIQRNTMKKYIALAALLSLAACGKKEAPAPAADSTMAAPGPDSTMARDTTRQN